MKKLILAVAACCAAVPALAIDLPACDNEQVIEALLDAKQAYFQSYSAYRSRRVIDARVESEIGADRRIRACSAWVRANDGESPTAYAIEWADKANGMFRVSIRQEYDLKKMFGVN